MDNREKKYSDGRSWKSAIEIQYEQKMNQLVESLEPGEDLQIEVFNTLRIIEDLTEIIDLFTNKFAQSQVDLIKGDQSS